MGGVKSLDLVNPVEPLTACQDISNVVVVGWWSVGVAGCEDSFRMILLPAGPYRVIFWGKEMALRRNRMLIGCFYPSLTAGHSVFARLEARPAGQMRIQWGISVLLTTCFMIQF